MLHSAIREPLNRACCPCLRDAPLIDNNEFVCQPTKVGDSILIYGRRKSYFPLQCLVGPDWPIVVLVYFLIIAIDGIVLYIVSPLGWVPVMLGGIGAGAVLVFYSMVACSDPGIIYKNDFTPTNEMTPLGVDIEAHNHGSPLVSAPTHGSSVVVVGHLSEKNPVASDQQHSDSSNSSGDSTAHNHTHATPAYIVQNSATTPLTLTQRRDPNKLIEIPQTMDCGNCEFKRPISARHCVHCKTCIDELDHHCPW